MDCKPCTGVHASWSVSHRFRCLSVFGPLFSMELRIAFSPLLGGVSHNGPSFGLRHTFLVLDFFDMLFHFVAEEPANIATIRVLLEPPPVDSDGRRRADGA